MKLKTMRHLTSLLIVFAASLPGSAAYAGEGKPAPEKLVGEIAYQFVGHLEEFDEQGRLLVWKSTIKGDVTGELKWWFVQPSPVSSQPFTGGRADFYSARWEIQVDGEVVLAGESAGKTVWRDGQDGIWDGHGIVMEARGVYSRLLGRKTYETGTVLQGGNPPISFSGAGLFLIY